MVVFMSKNGKVKCYFISELEDYNRDFKTKAKSYVMCDNIIAHLVKRHKYGTLND